MTYSHAQPFPQKIAKRPVGGTKTGGVGMRGVQDGFTVPLEGQDGTIGAGG